MDKDSLISLIEARRKKIAGDTAYFGEDRALREALGYLRAGTMGHVKFVLSQMAETYDLRSNIDMTEYWQQATKVLRELVSILDSLCACAA